MQDWIVVQKDWRVSQEGRGLVLGLEDAQGVWKFAQKGGFLVTHKNWRVGGTFEVLEGFA